MPVNKYIIDVSSKGVTQSDKKVKGLNNSLGNLAKKAGLAAAAYFGATALLSGFKSAIRLSAAQELAEKKLEAALGRVSKAQLEHAKALQQTSMFGDEVILEAKAMLAAFIKDEEQLKAATEATLDLAAAKGFDLVSAADLVGKSVGSSTNALTRYGIEVTGAVGSTERLESLTRNVGNLFGGQAKAQTDTMAGSIEQMKNAIGDAAEAIGDLLVPVIMSVAGFFKGAAEGVQDFMRNLTETPLEKTIRELERIGATGQIIVDLQRLQFKKALVEVNAELDKTGLQFNSVEEVQKKIADGEAMIKSTIIEEGRLQKELATSRAVESDDINAVAESRRGMSKGMADMIGFQERLTEDVQLDLDANEKRRESIEAEQETLLKHLDIIQEKIKLQAQLNALEQVEEDAEDAKDGEDPKVKAIEEFASVDALLHAKKLARINEAKQAMIDAGLSIVAAEKWKTEQIKRLDDEKEASNEDYVATTISGVRAALKAYLAQAVAGMLKEEISSKGIPGLITGTVGAVATAALFEAIVPKFAKGGDFVTAGPQMIMVGDNPSGRERVQITPLASNESPADSGGLTVIFQGDVIASDDYLENTFIPAINDLVSKGAVTLGNA